MTWWIKHVLCVHCNMVSKLVRYLMRNILTWHDELNMYCVYIVNQNIKYLNWSVAPSTIDPQNGRIKQTETHRTSYLMSIWMFVVSITISEIFGVHMCMTVTSKTDQGQTQICQSKAHMVLPFFDGNIHIFLSITIHEVFAKAIKCQKLFLGNEGKVE